MFDMEKETKSENKALRFVLAFDVIDEFGNSVMGKESLNAIFVNIKERFPIQDEHWGLPLLLGLYAKHIASLPEFSELFPWYRPISKGVEEPNNNSVHKSADTPFVYLMGNTLFVHPNKLNQISVEDSIPSGFPL